MVSEFLEKFVHNVILKCLYSIVHLGTNYELAYSMRS